MEMNPDMAVGMVTASSIRKANIRMANDKLDEQDQLDEQDKLDEQDQRQARVCI